MYPDGASDEQVESFIHNLIDKLLIRHCCTIFVGGDVSHSFRLASMFYKELSHQLVGLGFLSNVYAILGNHELWEFQSLDECQKAYQEMLKPLKIKLLCNEEIDLGPYLLIGGTGFAGCNKYQNANLGQYRQALNRHQETEESAKWREIYLEWVEKARQKNKQLVVLTHNPIWDWMGETFHGDENCIYFTGHTHHELLFHDNEHNIHIFADNQIGYKQKKIQLKEAQLYYCANPFSRYDDGIYEIGADEYSDFCNYADMGVQGTGEIKRIMRTAGCKFYMVLRSGYYGFFLISNKFSYICAGGRVKQQSVRHEIEYYYANFETMVSIYVSGLAPYRKIQEQISEYVKSFGGVGKIHGCIVDIDFFNHIMLNPYDNSLTIYNSPRLGSIWPYSSVEELLEEEESELLEDYKKVGSSKLLALNLKINDWDDIDDFLEVHTDEGMYALSQKVQQLQRLFSCKVLRMWDDRLLSKANEGKILQIGEITETLEVEEEPET